MIPIIYNISKSKEDVSASLESIKKSIIDNNELVIFDNYSENEILKNLPIESNVIQPNEKINENELLKIMIKFGFSIFNNANHLIILNNDFIFHKRWAIFMNYIFQNELTENIGIGSVFNPSPLNKNTIDLEPFLIKGQNIYSDAFIISRRLYNKMNSLKMFDKNEEFKLLKYDFESVITSYSYLDLINNPSERFLK